MRFRPTLFPDRVRVFARAFKYVTISSNGLRKLPATDDFSRVAILLTVFGGGQMDDELRAIKPGGRVEADSASGSVQVEGATRDVKARAASGSVEVRGSPGSNSFWDLTTVSGVVQLGIPTDANFHLSAEAVSGQIKADVPIIVEEQDKHSLRARVGNGGARVEVHAVSGEIRVRAS